MQVMSKRIFRPHHPTLPLTWQDQSLRYWVLVSALFILLGVLATPAAYAADAGYIARLVGTVKIDGIAAKQGSSFGVGATITTAEKSYAQLKFADGQHTFLKANTTLVIKNYAYDQQEPKKSASTLSLLKGGIRTVSGLIAKQNREAVRYETPTVTMGVRGTEFMLSIVNGQLFIHVLSGAIGFTPPLAGLDVLEAGGYLAVSDLGDVMATGDKAKEAAEKAGAFQQINTVDTSSTESPLQWGDVQITPIPDSGTPDTLVDIDQAIPTPPEPPVICQECDLVIPELESKGIGIFERID